jgi:hypothetical protein
MGSNPINYPSRACNSMVECVAHNNEVVGSSPARLKEYINAIAELAYQ